MKAGERPLLQRAFHPSQTGPLDTFEESFSSCIFGDGTRYVKTCSFPNPDRVVFLAFTYPRFISFFKLVIFGTNRLSQMSVITSLTAQTAKGSALKAAIFQKEK